MKKFYVDFSATMIVFANNREEADYIFWDKIYKGDDDSAEIDYVEENCIEEAEEEED